MGIKSYLEPVMVSIFLLLFILILHDHEVLIQTRTALNFDDLVSGANHNIGVGKKIQTNHARILKLYLLILLLSLLGILYPASDIVFLHAERVLWNIFTFGKKT